MPVTSPKMQQYFDKIEKDVTEIYAFATDAKQSGVDPTLDVECPPAKDMAGRVEKLIGPDGIGDIIRNWIEEGKNQDQICFMAMDYVIENYEKEGIEDPLDHSIRLALAIKTEGVVSAPLEGIEKIIKRKDPLGGPDYLSIYYAGPIRAAGGTVQALSILYAEYVRNKMNIAEWKATEKEVGRFVEEVKLYDQILNLQYPSKPKELQFAVRHLKIELNGQPTEKREVSAYRDLKRIESNRVRGGPCLVINDGFLLKSKKMKRVIDDLGMKGWEWLTDMIHLAYEEDDKEEEEGSGFKVDEVPTAKNANKMGDFIEDEKFDIKASVKLPPKETPVYKRKKYFEEKSPPLDKFVADVIAGRPIFSGASAIGGHRIRYGRSRNTGLAACGFHPSVMIILRRFLAVGTQLRIERPGKSGSSMPVDSIEPPVVLKKNGNVVQIWNIRDAGDLLDNDEVEQILFLGDILFGFGEFVENNHKIIPSGYVEEWWAQELQESIINQKKSKNEPFKNLPPCLTKENIMEFIRDPLDMNNPPTGLQTLYISKLFNIGIHPRYLAHWGNINGTDLLELRNAYKIGINRILGNKEDKIPDLSKVSWEELNDKLKEGLLIPNIEFDSSNSVKSSLQQIFTIHNKEKDQIRIFQDHALIFSEILGFGKEKGDLKKEKKILELAKPLTALEMFENLTTIIVPDKAPYYMGTRMGRPEKAKFRQMKPPVHALFPIGHKSELQRSFNKATQQETVTIQVAQKQCPKCKSISFLNKCISCGTHTDLMKTCPNCKKGQNVYPRSEDKCPKCHSFLSYAVYMKVPLKKYYAHAQKDIHKTIKDVKGVKGMTSEFKIPEPMEKGILRSIHDIWVYKDGTTRADATDIPLTHFNCKEIDTTVEKIRELGYEKDIYGKEIVNDGQIIEIKCQDILLTDHLGDYFVRVAQFVDDELKYLYKREKYYRIKKRHELIGHYMVGLAPHTSAGIIGRLIGFTKANSGYAHPFWHAAKRRNCFPGSSEILVEVDNKIQRISLEELYNNYFTDEGEYQDEVKQAKIRKTSINPIIVYSYDQNENKIVKTKLIEAIKAPSTDNLIEFKLTEGSFTTTPDHPVLVLENDKTIIKKALEVSKEDYFLKADIIDLSIANEFINRAPRKIEIQKINIIPKMDEFVYSVNADKFHTVLINENIVTHQCDGDEDGIMLLLDCLLNFSMYNLPSSLGGKMDAPLVISLILDPKEVDAEAHHVDYMSKYPLEFYRETLNFHSPNEIKNITLYKDVLNTEKQYEGCGFTHPTSSINTGPKISAYSLIDNMPDKIDEQIWIAKVISNFDEKYLIQKIIKSHFMPDMLGNLRSFAKQTFRCSACGEKYRRIPLSGRCTKCGKDKLLMTVHGGSIVKYLPKSLELAKKFDLGRYMEQRLELIQDYITSLTNNPKVKQRTLSSFF